MRAIRREVLIMRKVLLGVGVVLILLGGLWTLQGVGILGGSAMSGQSFWAIVGALLLLIGVVLCYVGLRRAPSV
jgi:hypothetical protein